MLGIGVHKAKMPVLEAFQAIHRPNQLAAEKQATRANNDNFGSIFIETH
jgi:hypothetical protein